MWALFAITRAVQPGKRLAWPSSNPAKSAKPTYFGGIWGAPRVSPTHRKNFTELQGRTWTPGVANSSGPVLVRRPRSPVTG